MHPKTQKALKIIQKRTEQHTPGSKYNLSREELSIFLNHLWKKQRNVDHKSRESFWKDIAIMEIEHGICDDEEDDLLSRPTSELRFDGETKIFQWWYCYNDSSRTTFGTEIYAFDWRKGINLDDLMSEDLLPYLEEYIDRDGNLKKIPKEGIFHVIIPKKYDVPGGVDWQNIRLAMAKLDFPTNIEVLDEVLDELSPPLILRF